MNGMSTRGDSVLDAALKLPVKERARLAAELVANLDGEAEDGVDAAWAAEVERRKVEAAEGKVRLVPWEKVRAEVTKAIKGR
jgi:putative addiction module component (TIGR02574 family)